MFLPKYYIVHNKSSLCLCNLAFVLTGGLRLRKKQEAKDDLVEENASHQTLFLQGKSDISLTNLNS